MNVQDTRRIFYGWWIVAAAFLNLYFTVGIVYYGFPRLYPSLVESLRFERTQVTRGLFYGFLAVAPFAGLLGGLIDRVGTRRMIRFGILVVSFPLLLMGRISTLWQYYLLCMAEVVGYILAGPITNQVLIANWFNTKRGRAMGYAYLGLGLGGAAAAPLINFLIERVGWRHAVEIVGAGILIVLLPVAHWVTRSRPSELGLLPDGWRDEPRLQPAPLAEDWTLARATRTSNFWLILAGTTLTLFTIGTVSQHLILFLTDVGYSERLASYISSAMMASSLAGRVIVGHFADRFSKKNVMALFYLLLAVAVPLLFFARRPSAAWGFAAVFGFAMGADYMLIPLVTAECFGLAALGRLLTFIIMTYSIAQFLGPTLAGKIYDLRHSYDLAWTITAAAGVLGSALIYAIQPKRTIQRQVWARAVAGPAP